VPEGDDTSLTLVKYTCSTETYVSEVDCEIDETGKTFDLVFWNGSAWEYHSTATTDGLGRIHWTGLNPLDYWLDEQDGDWCHLASDQLSDDGNWLALYEGEETVVEVYNCDGVPGKPGKTPTKYPNTGAGPEQGSGAPAELPSFAPLAALIALIAIGRLSLPVRLRSLLRPYRDTHREALGTARPARRPSDRKRADTHSTPPRRGSTQGAPLRGGHRSGPYETCIPEGRMPHTLTRRRIAALLTLPIGGTALVRSGLLAQADQVIEPRDANPPDGTSASLCLPATPDAEGDVDECPRGPVPVNLRIEAIGVEAPVEILETVGGVMQQPSDEAHVA